MKHQPTDTNPRDRRTNPSPAAWVVAVTLLAAALAGAITMAAHYRGRAATLQRQLSAATGHHSPRAVPLTLTGMAVRLPSRGTLSGGVTILAATSTSGLIQIEPSAHISGARPNTGYELTAFNCAGSSGYQTWAVGVTNAHGSAALSGRALSVSPRAEYWLYINPSSSGANAEAGLRASFTRAGFSASPALAIRRAPYRNLSPSLNGELSTGNPHASDSSRCSSPSTTPPPVR